MTKTEHRLLIIATAGVALALIGYFNQTLFTALNTVGREQGWLWANITSLGDAMVAIALLLVFVRRYPTVIAAALLAAIVGTVVVHAMKDFFDVPRPPAVLMDTLNVIGPALKSGAFPSGHSATAFILATIIVVSLRIGGRWQGRLIIGIAALVAISRCVVGVHWPLDIVVGSLIGAAVGMLCVYWARRWRWAASLHGQRILALLPIVACLSLPFYDTGYPQATLLHIGISATALLFSWRQLWLLYLPWHYPLTRRLRSI